MINLTRSIKKKIKEHSLRCQPKECCGLIVQNDQGLDIHECKNKATLNNKFSIDPIDYLNASRSGKITSVYHSHNKNADFSEYDKFNSNIHNLDYILYCIEGNTFLRYIANSSFNEYIGKKFEIGKQDCLTLVRDFYKKELNISIKDHAPCRNLNWKEEFGEVFENHFEEEGFSEVQNIKKYDGILFKFHKSGPVSHCAIYLGDGLILHQPRNSASRIDEYDDRYKRLTKLTVRHKNLYE